MILLLGATGYIGQAFANELRRRGEPFIPLSRRAIDYTRFDVLFDYLRQIKPTFLINAAGYTGKPNIDSCEIERAKTLAANAVFPQVVAKACHMTNVPWGHVSSASIYSGAKRFKNGAWTMEGNLENENVRRAFFEQADQFLPFTESDEPNFTFRHMPCSFYSGSKALAEETLRGFGNNYIWRPGIVFGQVDAVRNLITKLQLVPKLRDSVHPLSHRGDFVKACLDLWERAAPFGIYNVVNPGTLSIRQVAELLEKMFDLSRPFEFWKDDEEFYRAGAKALRPSCLLSGSKLLAAGVKMRPIDVAMEEALRRWRSASRTAEELVATPSYG